ncbi:MAG: hypothetical protein MK105_09305 [Crocinitomicaceae bacterium]|nr:hypothetical protein [Crocinitomicaceae bacterium]
MSFFLLLFHLTASAQCDSLRYSTPIFTSLYKHADVKCGEAPVWNIPCNNTDLFMDIYEPIGESQIKRPLMLWVRPGGFFIGRQKCGLYGRFMR